MFLYADSHKQIPSIEQNEFWINVLDALLHAITMNGQLGFQASKLT